MICLPIFQTVCFSLYVWFIVSRYGVIQSISESWYREGHMKWMFIMFVGTLAVPTLILGILTKNIWFDAAAVSLGIIAAAPAFRDKHKIVGILHTGGTVLGIAFACYALVTHGIYFPVVLCAVGSILPERIRIANTTFWVEIITFSSIELGIYQMLTLGI